MARRSRISSGCCSTVANLPGITNAVGAIMNFIESRELCNASAHLSRRTLLGAGGGALLMSSLARKLEKVQGDRKW